MTWGGEDKEWEQTWGVERWVQTWECLRDECNYPQKLELFLV